MAKIDAQLAAVREVLEDCLPADVADERARNIVQAVIEGGDYHKAADAALVEHWTLIPFTLPIDIVDRVADALAVRRCGE